jgi:hypothetical protein
MKLDSFENRTAEDLSVDELNLWDTDQFPPLQNGEQIHPEAA